MERVLIIDDEKNILTTLGRAIEIEGYEVSTALTAQRGLALVDSFQPDMVLLDLKLPDLSGLDVLQKIKSAPRSPAVVMISAHGSIDSAVQATRLGAVDFLEKPVDMDRVLLTIRNSLKIASLDAMQRNVEQRHGMVGTSAPLQQLIEQIHRSAPTRASVLVTGPTGAGKELVAKAIHELSRRSDEPFVRLNCGAIPENLVESELFGHERGAFTGAERKHEGRFERAHRGTLFLDEVGEMPLAAQVRLLRVIQEGELERVGGKQTIKVDVRLITATNRNLEDEIAAGRFREDLYYRLNVLPIRVPSLKERQEDLPQLASYLLKRSCEHNELGDKFFSEDGLSQLSQHHWPGNIRELAHTIERLAIMTPGSFIEREDIQAALPGQQSTEAPLVPGKGPLYPLLENFEKQIIQERLNKFDGKVSRAAEDLGLERSHLYKKIRQLCIARS
ncbi:MAG: sigma-54 dependent transcriptional regulator [Myxococcota bacterium]|nr:sigma-54 dependent transcriptional regulator [Myxococcota bacterium]